MRGCRQTLDLVNNFFKSRHNEILLITIGTCLALAALKGQLKSNGLSQEANAITQEGNVMTEQTYKLQLWDDCHDRIVSARAAVCADKLTPEGPEESIKVSACLSEGLLGRKRDAVTP